MIKHPIETEKIKKILDNYGLGNLESFEENEISTINPVFLINQKYILRVDLGESDNKGKFKKESILFDLLPNFSVPTPKLITFDDSCTLIDKPFLLINYVPGENLKSGFNQTDNETKGQLSFELGDLANKIHSVTANDLGNQEIFGDINTWVEKEKEDFNTYWKIVKENNYLSDDTNDKIKIVFDNYYQISKWQETGRLVHGDFSPNNIRISNSHINGIFDFEFATIADPLYDLQKLPINFQLDNGFNQEKFLAGYGIQEFSEPEIIRLKTYCLAQGLWEIWATHTKQFPYTNKEIEEGKQLIENTLSNY